MCQSVFKWSPNDFASNIKNSVHYAGLSEEGVLVQLPHPRGEVHAGELQSTVEHGMLDIDILGRSD